VLPCELPLHDQVRALETDSRIVEKASEDRPGPGEGEVGDDGEGAVGPAPGAGVDLEHRDARVRGEPVAKLRGKRRVDLEREDVRTRVGECARQDAASGTDVDHEVSRRDAGVAHKRSCESATAKEVLAGRFPFGSSPNGHGRPPSSSRRAVYATRSMTEGIDAVPICLGPGRQRLNKVAHPVRQVAVIGRRGARLDELEALYRSRFDVFARVAASVTGDSERARDAVQEAFATAVRKRGSFRGEGPLEAWVWRIVLNAARSDVRRSIPTADHDDERFDANGQPEQDADLRVALARLPERQRTAVFLRYYADLDYAAIGEALGVSTGTVGATLNAAHASLRSQLEGVRT